MGLEFTAKTIYSDADNVEQVKLFRKIQPVKFEEPQLLLIHEFTFGGTGDGFCYTHQSFSCIEEIDGSQRKALNEAEDYVP